MHGLPRLYDTSVATTSDGDRMLDSPPLRRMISWIRDAPPAAAGFFGRDINVPLPL
jgi:hypothetical protein